MTARRLRPALDLVSAIGSLAFDLQHHDDAEIQTAVRYLRAVNAPLFDWLVDRLREPATTQHAVARADESGKAVDATNLSSGVSERTHG